jgi:hypothetical protein
LGRSNHPKKVRSHRGDLTALGMRSIRPGQSEQVFIICCIPMCIATLVQGECAPAQGELACVQGKLFVLLELWICGLCLFLEHDFFSDVSSRCPCLRGTRLVLLQVILLFAFSWLSIACWSFSLAVIALIKGEIEDLCGSRTGGVV